MSNNKSNLHHSKATTGGGVAGYKTGAQCQGGVGAHHHIGKERENMHYSHQ